MTTAIDLRDIAIIDGFPSYNTKREVLVVGCGLGRIDKHLGEMGYNVYSTDIVERGLENFAIADIFDLKSFPVLRCEVVLASQVLEHLLDWKRALENLIELTGKRLIITVPYATSFARGLNDKAHVVFWKDKEELPFLGINEFKKLAYPYKTTISKTITKPSDEGRQCVYLIVIDKLQEQTND